MAENIKKRFLKNSIWSFFISLVNRMGGLVLTILLARFLLPEKYGVYSLVLSTAMIFYTFADLGINSSFLRYMSLSMVNDKKKLSSYYRYLLKLKFLFTLTASLLLFVLAYPISVYIFKNQEMILPLIASSFYIFVLSFEGFYTQIFYSIEKVNYIGIKEFFNQVLRVLLIVPFFLLFSKVYYIFGVFALFSFISLLMLLFSLYYTKKLIPEIYEKPKYEIDKKRVQKFVAMLTIASISTVFFSYIDSIILGIFLTPEYVGYYRAAFSLVLGISGMLGFFSIILLPLLTKANSSEKSKIINSLFRYTSIIIFPSIFGLLVLGNYFIRLFYDYSYLPATLPLYFLSVLIFPIVVTTILLTLFSAEEKPEIFAKLILVTTLINVVLNIILIKYLLTISSIWATAGAGIATSISYFFYLFACVYFLKKEFKMTLNFKVILKPLIASLVMAGVLLWRISYVSDMNFLSGIENVILGVLVYFVVLILLRGIKKEDLYNLHLLIKK